MYIFAAGYASKLTENTPGFVENAVKMSEKSKQTPRKKLLLRTFYVASGRFSQRKVKNMGALSVVCARCSLSEVAKQNNN